MERLGRNKYWGAGIYANDAVNGIPRPKQFMIPQRGGLVSERWEDGTRDYSEPGDEKFHAIVQLAAPEPLYRVETAAFLLVLTMDADERDDLVDDDYRWQVIGYAYPDGDEETGLTRLYRSHHSGTGDTLHTTSAAEHAAALAAGYLAVSDSIFVFTAGALNRRPIYRWYKSSTAVHYYGTSLDDIAFLGSAWALQQTAFYALTGAERTVA
mgnify:FL=1